MASTSFRDSINSLGWSRREHEVPINTSPPSLLGRLQNLNPFGDRGHVRLPITETNPGAPLPAPTRREEEEGWFARKYPLFFSIMPQPACKLLDAPVSLARRLRTCSAALTYVDCQFKSARSSSIEARPSSPRDCARRHYGDASFTWSQSHFPGPHLPQHMAIFRICIFM